MVRMTYDGPARQITRGGRHYNLDGGTFDAHPVDVGALRRLGAERVDETTDPEALDDLTVEALRDLAREREIEGRSSMSKAELLTALAEEG